MKQIGRLFSAIVAVAFALILVACEPTVFYTVSFNPNGGILEGKDSILVESGHYLEAFPEVSRQDYVLIGWFSDAALTEQWFLETLPINSDITLIASWAQATITISFESSCDNIFESQTFAFGGRAIEPETPTKDGHVFLGWFVDGQPKDFESIPARSMTLVASWGEPPAIIIVTFWTDETKTERIDSQVFAFGGLITQIDAPTKAGHVFVGWFADGEPVDFLIIPTADVDIYPMFVLEVTLTFNSMGGEPVESILIGAGQLLPELPVVHKTGYIFGGWLIADGGLPTGLLILFEQTYILGNTWVFALWIPRIIVSFDSRGGEQIEDFEIIQGQHLPPSLPTPERFGYVFAGWYLDEAFEKPVEGFDEIGQSLTLFANWQPRLFELSFNSLGFGDVDSVQIQEGTSVLSLPTITHHEYALAGWYTCNEFITEFTIGPIEKDMTLYARWVPRYVTLSFNTMGGNPLSAINIIQDEALPIVPNATKEGFVFAGWYTCDELIMPFILSPLDENTTIFARWLSFVFLSFDVDGGQGLEQIKIVQGENLPELPTPLKEGYVFLGWFIAPYSEQRFIDVTITIDTTIFARWVPTVVDQGVTYGGFRESMWAQWTDENSNLATVHYSMHAQNNWQPVDTELVRSANRPNSGRVDIVGLKAGFYDIKIVNSLGQIILISNIFVDAHVREGYAHFNYANGVGAYNNDGTLKDNAVVVYVTNENKNTVTVPGLPQVGIGWILNNNQYQWDRPTNTSFGRYPMNQTLAGFNRPISFRFIGEVRVPDGLTVFDSHDRGGSTGDNGDMARMWNANEITIGGIGYDASIYGWGIHLISASPGRGRSFEVRNLLFTQYSEDAVGVEGMQSGTNLDRPAERAWIHHNTFLPGFHPNPAEDDKNVGDGSVDFKRGQFFTVAFNQFFGTDKTSLIGGGDGDRTFNVTFHHNHFRNVRSRTPLTRRANLHMFNNIFEITNYYTGDQASALDARVDSSIFSEANFFKGMGAHDNHVFRARDGGIIISYGDVLVSSIGGAHHVTRLESRTQAVTTTNVHGNWHTDPARFYFNAATGRTNATSLTCAVEARAVVTAISGRQREIAAEIEWQTITNLEPVTITQDMAFNNVALGTRPRPAVYMIVFRLLTNAEVNIVRHGGASGVNPHLLDIYGRPILTEAGNVVLQPGVYVVMSSRTMGRPTEVRDTTVSVSITLNQEELRQKLLQNAIEAIDNLPINIEYKPEHLSLIRQAQTAIGLLQPNQLPLVDHNLVTNAFNDYVSAGVLHIDNLIGSIGLVNEDSFSVIFQAQQALDHTLPEIQKAISNRQTLVNAWATFEQFHVQSIIKLIDNLENPQLVAYDDVVKILALSKQFDDVLHAFNHLIELNFANEYLVANKDKLFGGLARIELLRRPIDLIEFIDTFILEDLTLADRPKIHDANDLFELLNLEQLILVGQTRLDRLGEINNLLEELVAQIRVEMIRANISNNFFTQTGGGTTGIQTRFEFDGVELTQVIHLNSGARLIFETTAEFTTIEIRLDTRGDRGVRINGAWIPISTERPNYVIFNVVGPATITLQRGNDGGSDGTGDGVRIAYMKVTMQG